MFAQTNTTIGPSPTNRSSRSRHRRAFTLIELLVVVMVIGILATFVMVALAGVNQTAKEDRTTALIARINELLMEKYASYQYRRMPPANARLALKRQQPGFEAWLQNNGGYGLVARDRLTATRDMMRMELPCTIDEVRGPTEARQTLLRDHIQPKPLVPALSRAYYARALRTLNGNLNAWTPTNESAECLYLILTQMRSGDSSAMEFFTENEIGDTDGDGMNEILDGWGQPIYWLRWAPGFIPHKNPEAPELFGFGSTLQVPLVNQPEQEDMFDPMEIGISYAEEFAEPIESPSGFGKIDRARALLPVIFSAGPDERFGIRTGGVWFSVNSDPYDPRLAHIGGPTTPRGEGATDNITNHLLSTR